MEYCMVTVVYPSFCVDAVLDKLYDTRCSEVKLVGLDSAIS